MSVATIESRLQVNRWFYIGVAMTLIVLNLIGFAPSLVEPSGRMAPLPLTPLVTVHVIIASIFLLVFLAQTTLVATGRTDIHRKLGIAGTVLALAFVVTGYLSLVEQARRGFDLAGDIAQLPIPPGASVVGVIMVPIIFFLTFGVLLGAAVYYRQRPEVHKRLMLLAILGSLFTTPVAHITGHWPALTPWAGLIFPLTGALFLSVPAIYDRLVIGRIHPVSLWVALAVFVTQTIFGALIVPSAAWDATANWLIQ
jgi:uncharacterized membrane protein YozB (DUF420 family)